ncbi:hypothetical protein G6F40_017553 [Rhizopus arrhizus]|nr:hypothetical protein G6F40_017553 [Rhizopus arrhizus]
MPVLGGHHRTVVALRQQRGNRCHQRIALVAGQRATRHEVRLQVDHQQGDIGGQGGHGRSGTTEGATSVAAPCPHVNRPAASQRPARSTAGRS